jgi:hypothetical protein
MVANAIYPKPESLFDLGAFQGDASNRYFFFVAPDKTYSSRIELYSVRMQST